MITTILERFLIKIKINEATGCWEWTAATAGDGYGWLFARKTNGRKTSIYSHQFSYEFFNHVEIPSGLTVDHICRNMICVNPFHLRLLSLVDNILCGQAGPANNKRKIYCKRGHPLSGENLYIVPNSGYRQCRTCIRYQAKGQYIISKLINN